MASPRRRRWQLARRRGPPRPGPAAQLAAECARRTGSGPRLAPRDRRDRPDARPRHARQRETRRPPHLSGRDQLSWSLAHNRFPPARATTSATARRCPWSGPTLFFDGPAWQLRGGIDYQHNRLENRLPDDLLAAHGGALTLDGARSQDLLQDRYGQVYLGSTWRRGFPGALNRSRPQYLDRRHPGRLAVDREGVQLRHRSRHRHRAAGR